MRLPRLFATPAKPTEPTPQTAPRGQSGRWHTSGYLQFEELNAELQHPQGHAIYDRMWRTDPDVRRSLAMALNPILGATWSMEPYGGDDATDLDRTVAEAAAGRCGSTCSPACPGTSPRRSRSSPGPGSRRSSRSGSPSATRAGRCSRRAGCSCASRAA
jgi:hypothetical protein